MNTICTFWENIAPTPYILARTGCLVSTLLGGAEAFLGSRSGVGVIGSKSILIGKFAGHYRHTSRWLFCYLLYILSATDIVSR